jgi:hypothetical protein
VDADGDGFGDPQSGELSCGQPEGRIADGTDCDDADPETFPGATELCDGVDQDCDGRADEDTVFYVDGDRDGFGKPGATVAAPACAQPPDTATNDDDCDDTDPLVNPAAEELCNLADDDCDGAVDEDAADARTWYRDVDADGWGNTRRTRVACARPGGWIARSGDCNDADAGINPGATELCDGLDNDCDASVDEDAGDSLVWFADGDGDGFGRPGSDLRACASPPGHVGNDGDCDDTDSLVFPGAPETCNGADDDCDGAIDEDPVDGRVIYADRDADGFGDDATARAVCERPGPGFVGRGGDCDDLDRTAFPGAPETCDGNDDDCDGLQDDGGVCPCPVEWYDGHAYAFCTSFPVPWVAASQVCQAGGYTLVAIGDAPENDFVAQTGAFYGGPYWTGLNDRGQGNEGRFRWSNGEALTYTAWAPGEPNDANGEDCVELRRDASWNDANCALTRSFVCEAD